MKTKLISTAKLIGFIAIFPFLAIGVNIRGKFDDYKSKKLDQKKLSSSKNESDRNIKIEPSNIQTSESIELPANLTKINLTPLFNRLKESEKALASGIKINSLRDPDDLGFLISAVDTSIKDDIGNDKEVGHLFVRDESIDQGGNFLIDDIYVDESVRRTRIATQMLEQMAKNICGKPAGAEPTFTDGKEVGFSKDGQAFFDAYQVMETKKRALSSFGLDSPSDYESIAAPSLRRPRP